MAEGIQQHRLQRHIETAHGGLDRDRGRVMAGMFRQIKEQNSLRHWVRTLQHTKWREHGSIKLFCLPPGARLGLNFASGICDSIRDVTDPRAQTTMTQLIRTRPCPSCFLCGATGELLYPNLSDRL